MFIQNTSYSKMPVNRIPDGSENIPPCCFVKNSVVVPEGDPIEGMQLTRACEEVVGEGNIYGMQRLGDLWRIYCTTPKARNKLLAVGIEVSIINAYQLYKAYYMRSVSTIKMLSHFEFRLEIIRSLRQTSSRKRCREVPTPSPRTIEKCTSIRMLGNKKRCHQCKKHGRKTASQRLPETVYGCNKCFVHICQGDCFHEHLQEQYKWFFDIFSIKIGFLICFSLNKIVFVYSTIFSLKPYSFLHI